MVDRSAAPLSTHAGLGQRPQLWEITDKQRLEVLRLTAPKECSLRAIARRFGVTDKAIRNLVRQKDEILRRTRGVRDDRLAATRRYNAGAYPELEQALYAWLRHMRSLHIGVPSSLVLSKAQKIALSLDPPLTTFKASPGWLANFHRRYDMDG
ncbi:hypothetical protein SPRG_04159 [Saprolegnia parasitica CBS 223.65]|uniref:HTH CENPB-type domain-containing protein n=1 Tax=Saprolegnia parasitica (strain CBS 223.65) TaxID=695850 RepID=A0A067CWP9_SAPPC|nr:hypothetical protein SPRG_04159 [Saprolegnia parasitica CBS 223.65]KDO30971.1 hypothetical protein SPRG_04159 [Saprolegnia parasitica CBS 223.65]|eukprot:XP_012198155.1 hypothetical protein SPRG_04159 [Saprolegnia parasitica CBS 223.65]